MIQFFPSNPASSAAVQAYVRAGADTDVANIRAQQAQAEAQAQMANQNQQRFFQQQQAQQQNDLQRQQLANQDFFNRGRLTNEQAGNASALEIAKLQYAVPKVDPNTWRSNELAAQQGEIADAANNHASILTELDKTNAQLAQLAQAQKDAANVAPGVGSAVWKTMTGSPGGFQMLGSMTPNNFFNRQSVSNKAYGEFTNAAPFDAGKTLDDNILVAAKALTDKKTKLEAIAKRNSEAGLDQHVAQTPNGWVPTFRPTAGTTNGFFRSAAPAIAPTATVTNAPTASFFRPSAAVAPSAPPIIKFDPRSGRPIAYDAVTKVAIGYAD